MTTITVSTNRGAKGPQGPSGPSGPSNNTFTGNVTGTLKGTKDFMVIGSSTATSNTIDLSISNYFKHTLTGSTTFTFANAPASGNGQMISVLVIQDGTGGRTVTWANTVYWADGSVHSATTSANAKDLWTFFTYDGGSTFWGNLAMKDVK